MVERFCIKCGTQAIQSAAFCHNCGAKIHNERTQSAPFIQLPDPTIDPREIILENDSFNRVWCKEDGFELIHNFARKLCAIAFKTIRNNSQFHKFLTVIDVAGDHVFGEYETDLYPPDGYKSLFIKYWSDAPTLTDDPEGNGIALNFSRSFEVFYAQIAHNPHRGKNYANTAFPRVRDSAINKIFKLTFRHKFIDGEPSRIFRYSFDKNDYCPEIMRLLGLDCISTEKMPSALYHTVPGLSEALSKVKGVLEGERVMEEHWDQEENMWRPRISVFEVRHGFFADNVRHQVWLEPTTTVQRPPAGAQDLSYLKKNWKPLRPPR